MEILDVVMVCVGLMSLAATVFGVRKFRHLRAAERAREQAHLITWLAENEKRAKDESVAKEAATESVSPSTSAVLTADVAVVAPLGVDGVVESVEVAAPATLGDSEPVVEAALPVRTLADEMADFFGHPAPSVAPVAYEPVDPAGQPEG